MLSLTKISKKTTLLWSRSKNESSCGTLTQLKMISYLNWPVIKGRGEYNTPLTLFFCLPYRLVAFIIH